MVISLAEIGSSKLKFRNEVYHPDVDNIGEQIAIVVNKRLLHIPLKKNNELYMEM